MLNFHESVGGINDVVTLQLTMSELKIEKTVLAGIPSSLLHFNQEAVTLDGGQENNDLLKQVHAQTEAENAFDFFCTIDPLSAQLLTELEKCLENGAVGVKLYNGYSYSHLIPVDDPSLGEFYSELEEKEALLLLPVNTGIYQSELENVLKAHPRLSLICPHYCLASQSLDRLTILMEEHPNLYLDTSFGSTDFALEGFKTITENNEAFRDFFIQFQDRIVFATNNVITSKENKDQEFLTRLYKDYFSILTESNFASAMNQSLTYKGLELPYAVQQKVFWQNGMNLLQ